MDSADIIMGVRAPKPINGQEIQINKSNIANALQNRQINQMKIDDYNTGKVKSSNVAKILGEFSPEEAPQVLRSAGYSDVADQMEDRGRTIAKDQAGLDKSKYELARQHTDDISSVFGSIKDNATPETLQQGLGVLVEKGTITPEQAQQKLQEAMSDPQGIQGYATRTFQQGLDAAKQLETFASQNRGGSTRMTATNPVSGKVRQIDEVFDNDPNKAFTMTANGSVPNAPYQAYEKSKAKAGASNTSIKIENKTGESLAKEVGGMMKDSTAIADGAVKQIDAAQRVVKAVNSGNLITGPGAGVRLKANQLAQIVGVGGQNEAERIANTREVLRGFAELTLQGRQQMKGQGAITESEGKLAEKAMSGDIEDLTAAEIKQLAKASERAARFNYGQYDRKMKTMRNDPNLQGLTPYYEAAELPAEVVDAPAGNHPAEINNLLNKYLPKNGK